MKAILFLLIGVYGSIDLLAQKTEILFEVTFRGDKIGTLEATESRSRFKSVKNLQSNTKSKILFISVYVESDVKTVQENGVLIEGTAYRSANHGDYDVHARTVKIDNTTYRIERNGVIDKIENQKITFCVIDLFFSEPIGITKVFSNMYAQMLEVVHVNTGKYQVIAPDGKNSFYIYENHILSKIEVETPVGTVFSTRISKW